MPVQVIVFGQLTDIIGKNAVTIDDVTDTTQLINQLNEKYPALLNVPYLMAVDKQVVNCHTVLTGNHTVALLPPFSGG